MSHAPPPKTETAPTPAQPAPKRTAAPKKAAESTAAKPAPKKTAAPKKATESAAAKPAPKRAAAPKKAAESAAAKPAPKKAAEGAAAQAQLAPFEVRHAKAERIRLLLEAMYPQTPIPLDHSDPFTLLVAVMLSAQTTDKKVNEVTPALFAEAPDPARMAALEVSRIHTLIRQVGLAPTKARHLQATAQLLLERHAGQVPADMAALEALPGVGHKTASVVMCQAFGEPAMPVDTHIHRLATRWGLTSGRNVRTTEADLKALYAREHWNTIHLRIIYFGREHCPARNHDPAGCPICSFAAAGATP